MTQIELNWDAPPSKAKAPTLKHLELEMSQGKSLADALQAINTDIATLTEHGIETFTETIPYPKGVAVRGRGKAKIRLECLYRILGGKPKRIPTFMKDTRRYARPVRSKVGFYGLAKSYVKITINGTVKISSGKFTATLPKEI